MNYARTALTITATMCASLLVPSRLETTFCAGVIGSRLGSVPLARREVGDRSPC